MRRGIQEFECKVENQQKYLPNKNLAFKEKSTGSDTFSFLTSFGRTTPVPSVNFFDFFERCRMTIQALFINVAVYETILI
jgi:hypothetical protein